MGKPTQAEYQASIEKAAQQQLGKLELEDETSKDFRNPGYEEPDEPEEGQEEPGEEGKEEEELYTKEQVSLIVKTRLEKAKAKIDKLNPIVQTLDKLCAITGLTRDQLQDRLDKMSLAEQSQVLGVPVDELQRRQAAQNNPKEHELQRKLEIVEMKAEPKYKDLDLYLDAIDELREDHPTLTMKQAYALVKGDGDLKAARLEGEQLAMAKVVNGRKKGLVQPTGSTPPPKQMDRATIQAARQVGMDPAEYAAFQNIDNIDAYRAHKNRDKK